ncbi:MAG: DUF4394 domain-containing protein [Saprospiraceae bacterium]|nr:DUF4394 domain-containing protein [Saprospiraceae bacterium]
MRLSLKLFNYFAAAFFGILLAAGCTSEDNVSPNDNAALEERSLIGTIPSIPLIGLTPTNELVHLLSGPPVVEKGVVPISGLRPDELMIAIDTRTKTKELYGVSNQSVIYKINPITGVATALTGQPMVPAIEGQMVGFDFDPVEDVIRLVSDLGQNLRLSPATGQVLVIDTPLNPGTPSVQGGAYSYASRVTRSMFHSLDVTEQALFRQHPASNGYMFKVGNLGFSFSGDGGFEITNKNQAFAVQYGKSNFPGTDAGSSVHDDITVDAYRLLSINLTYGGAKSFGRVRPMIGLTVR